MVLYRIDDAQVRDAETGALLRVLVGQQVQIVLRDTTNPAPILDETSSPIAGSLLTVNPSIAVPRFWIDTVTPSDLYLDWLDPVSNARGPVEFDAVLRDAAQAARESANDSAESAAASAESAAASAASIALAFAPTAEVVAGVIADPDSDAYQAVGVRVTAATQRMRPVSLSSSLRPDAREYPTLVKNPNAPVLTFADQSAASLYWPWIVDRWVGNPEVPAADRFALYYSTDHAPGSGGIYLVTGPNPWTWTTDHGEIYDDDAGGDQTETPSILWDEANYVWLMYYQQRLIPGALGDQQTVLATSSDGLTWTRYGIVVEHEAIFAGTGHVGYFLPFRIGGEWVGYSLNGSNAWRAIWYSSDGYTWRRDPRLMPSRVESLRHLAAYVEDDIWTSASGPVLMWHGALWQLASPGAYAPGGVVLDKEFVAARLSDDYRDWLGTPGTLTLPKTWETDVIGSLGNVVAYDGRLYTPYRADGPQGAFGLLEVV